MLSAPLLRALLNVAVATLGLGALVIALLSILAMRSAADIQYFRLRRNRLAGAWIGLALAVVAGSVAYVLFTQTDPITFHYYPPTPSLTPSLTATTVPTATLTPYVTATITSMPTPYLPPVVGLLFKSSVTPAANALFSELMFTQSIDERVRPLTPGKTFTNPLTTMYAVFHFENVNNGAQYTALWWRDGELVYYETKIWERPGEGFAYSLWKPADPQAWKAGTYEVQIFLGANWKSVGKFVVQGDPFTRTPTRTPSPTGSLSPTPSRTPSITPTPQPTRTATEIPSPTSSRSPTVSPTPQPSATLVPSSTPSLTLTPSITPSPRPSRTPTITPSPTFTRTVTPTYTPTKTWTPSNTPWPTRTRTSIPRTTATFTITPSPTPTLSPTPRPSPTPSQISSPRPSYTPRPTLLPWPTGT
jgi:hypothetical protein